MTTRDPDEQKAKSSSISRDADLRCALPGAHAVLHPLLVAPETPLRIREQVSGLTGVGMAFKLAQALLVPPGSVDHMLHYLDLVALGTIADVGRITGENRIFVKHGLDRFSSDKEQRPGICALKEVSGLDGKNISVGAVGFSLAPRINASGRLERADTAFRLLISDSPADSRTLAAALDRVNRERQSIEEIICEQAKELCTRHHSGVIGAFVLASDTWHPGVIGIVASRIVEEFYRPTALICIKDGIGKGSARSIPGFDLFRGLDECRDLLLGFGGHTYAAGFTIAEDRIPQFRERLGHAVLRKIGADGFRKTLLIDGAVTLDDLTIDLLTDIEKLAPFGPGNPEPRLGARDLEVISSRVVGSKHLKLRLKARSGTTLNAIAFNKAPLLGRRVRDGMKIAVVFTPRLNSWNGNTAVELDIKDIKPDK